MNYMLLAAVAVIGLPIVAWKFMDQFGAGLVVLFGIYMLGDSVLTHRDMAALAERGQQAKAEPVGDSYTVITKQRSGSKRFKARIMFETAGGKLYSEEASIPDEVLEKFKRGEKAAVTYLPSNPKVYRFNPLRAPDRSDILLSLGVIAAASLWIGFKRLTAAQPAQA